MTKKKAKVVSAELVSSAEPEIELKIEVTKNDVINVAVAKYEEELTALQKANKKDVTRVKKEIAQVQKAVAKECEALLFNKDKAPIKKLVTAAEALGLEISHTTSARGISGKNVIGTLAITLARPDQRYSDGTVNLPRTVKAPAALLKKNDSEPKLLEEIQELYDTGADLRRKLAEMSTIERKARARLTAQQLERTASGRAILDGLDLKSIKQLTLE